MARAKKPPAPAAETASAAVSTATPEAPKEVRQPRFSNDGVLLNPEDCVVSSDGVITAKVR